MPDISYLKVIKEDGSEALGGSQTWIEDPKQNGSYCGIVAGLDRVLEMKGIKSIDMKEYMQKLQDAAEYIRPVMLPFNIKPVETKYGTFYGSFGVSAGRLKRGIRRLGEKYGINIRLKKIKLKDADKLLAQGEKLIFLIRAPLKNVTLRNDNRCPSEVNAHWVTAYASDEENYMVQSWGREYKIAKADFKKRLVFVTVYQTLVRDE